MIEAMCRDIDIKTKNMANRLNPPTDDERKDNVSNIRLVLDRLVLDKVIIKRTAISKDPSTNEVLVDLLFYETRVIKCSLTTTQRRIILKADEVIKSEVKEVYAR